MALTTTTEKSKTAYTTKVLTVIVLLSLGRESTTRDYTVVFDANELINEEAEAIKIANLARKKYTSIIHLGGQASVFSAKVS